MKIIKFIKNNKLIRRLQLFDLIVITALLLLGASFLIFFFRKSQYITVKIKVTEKNILYANSNPPSWFVYLLKTGMQEKDGLGRISAEILDVYSYDIFPETKAAYLTLKLRTTYNKRTKEYKYKGRVVSVGEGVRTNFQQVLLEGLIVEVEDLAPPFEESFLEVECQLMDLAFWETTGVDSFIGEAISVGDKIYDSSGNVMAEVLEKKVLPAKKNTFDDRGNVYQRFDPRKKDIYLKLRLKIKKINNEYYFFDDVGVKVGKTLPLNFENINVWPVITKMSITE